MTFVDEQFDSIKTNIQKEMDRLQNLADAQVQPPEKLHKYTNHESSKYKFSRFDNMWGTFNLTLDCYFGRNKGRTITTQDLEDTLNQFDSAVEQWKKDNKTSFELNQEIIEHNKTQFDRVCTIMKTLGVKTQFTRSYFKTSRSRKMTTERTSAKWPDEVKDVLPMDCGWEATLKKFKLQREKIETFGLNKIKEYEEKLRKDAEEKSRKEEEELKLKTLAMMSVKYCMDLNDGAEDILNKIISECKYLYLAHHLEMNRNDWTNGYDYAEDGLSGFIVESEKDKPENAIIDATDFQREYGDYEYKYEFTD